MLQVFLSYSSADTALARLFKTEVDATERAQVYMAGDDVQPGGILVDKVKKAIDACDAVVVLITRQSQHSPWVNQEIGFALSKEKLVIPLVEAGVDVSSHGMLAGLEHVTVDPADPQKAVASLSAFITKRAFTKEVQQLGWIVAIAGVLVLLSRKPTSQL